MNEDDIPTPISRPLRNILIPIYLFLLGTVVLWADGGVVTKCFGILGIVALIGYAAGFMLLGGKRTQLLEYAPQGPDGSVNPMLVELAKTIQYTNETFWVALIFFTIYAAFSLCASLEQVKPIFENGFSFRNARIEWLVAVSAGLAVIGAIWAVWAKIMADKAFRAAEAATSEARNAYLAITTRSIQFEHLIGREELRRHIDSAKGRLRLLLGLPQVGYFYKDRTLNAFTLIDEACEISMRIVGKTSDILQHGGRVDILYFDKELCSSLATKTDVNDDERNAFLTTYEAFVSSMQRIAARDKTMLERLIAYPYSLGVRRPTVGEFDPGLRIALIDRAEPRKKPSEKAIIWFVSDFLDDSPTNFRAAALETDDPALIGLLNSLFDYYLMRFKPLLPANPLHDATHVSQRIPAPNVTDGDAAKQQSDKPNGEVTPSEELRKQPAPPASPVTSALPTTQHIPGASSSPGTSVSPSKKLTDEASQASQPQHVTKRSDLEEKSK